MWVEPDTNMPTGESLARQVLFAGDDVTDEDALARLHPGDIGVKVGLDFTQAEFRVEAPVHVAELLEAVLRERRENVAADQTEM